MVVQIASSTLRVEVSPQGAELQSIVTDDGVEWLWQGDARYWTGRAPILFPVVGRSPADRLSIAGRPYPMNGHGFARNSRFIVATQDHSRCVFRLSESAATRQHYPFAFDLDVTFAVAGRVLDISAAITNRDTSPMPASLGFHPAFAWPVKGAGGREHVCLLDHDGEPVIRRLDTNGLLLPGGEASPFRNGELVLHHRLFDAGAIILDHAAGNVVHYGPGGGQGIEIAYPGLPHLGIWTKPDAPFICIEPWHGLPPELGASVALELRPGIVTLQPGATRSFAMRLTFGVAIPADRQRAGKGLNPA